MYRIPLILTVLASTAHAGEIDQTAALAAIQQPNSVLLDVRTATEYAQGALPGAVRIESHYLAGRVADLAPDKNQPVIIYCRTGRRSADATGLLKEMGYSNVINAGGYDDLKALAPEH